MFNRSYLQERKMEKRGQKELLTIRNLHHRCHRVSSLWETRRFSKCFRYYSALSKERRWKTFRRNSIIPGSCLSVIDLNSHVVHVIIIRTLVTLGQLQNLPPEIIASTSPCSFRQSLCNLTYWLVFLCYCCIHCCNFNYLKQSADLNW